MLALLAGGMEDGASVEGLVGSCRHIRRSRRFQALAALDLLSSVGGRGEMEKLTRNRKIF